MVHKLRNVCYLELLIMWGRYLDTSFLEGRFGRVGGTEDTESAVWSLSLYVLLRYLGKKYPEEAETTLEVLGEVFIEYGEGKLRWCQGTAMSQKLETEPCQRGIDCCVL